MLSDMMFASAEWRDIENCEELVDRYFDVELTGYWGLIAAKDSLLNRYADWVFDADLAKNSWQSILMPNDWLSGAMNADVARQLNIAKQLESLSSSSDWLLQSNWCNYRLRTEYFTEVAAFIVRSDWVLHRD